MKERGAVSIFIVIFTALLVTVVTTSFVQIMLRNQQQASDNDLSQSAYDSALAGVEDAKRALVRLKKCQLNSPMPADCVSFVSALRGDASGWTSCEVLGAAGVADFQGSKHEVRVGDDMLNQAYTCVKIKVRTEEYKGVLTSASQSVVVPLVPADANPNDIQRVRISWFTREDVATGVASPTLPIGEGLPQYTSWPDTHPPIIRAQLIQFDEGLINIDEFDSGASRTRLLYPQNGPRPDSDSFSNDERRTGPKSPSYGGCEANFNYGGYACSVEVGLPAMSAGQTREAYLQLAGLYIKSIGMLHYKVEMLGTGAGSIGGRFDFDNVQPEVDSTGRTSDLYRRVKARVDVSESGIPDLYPDAALSTDNICKEFFITDRPGDYEPNGNTINGACTP